MTRVRYVVFIAAMLVLALGANYLLLIEMDHFMRQLGYK